MACNNPIVTLALPRSIARRVAQMIEPVLQQQLAMPQSPQQQEVVWQLRTTLDVLENVARRAEISTPAA